MLTRRMVLASAATLPVLPNILRAETASNEALASSRLIYLTPIRSDGAESACKGEVWFMWDAPDIYVVTQATAWRAEAVRKGLTKARIWVGEFGVWTNANDKFRKAPELMLDGVLETDATAWDNTLEKMGKKYSDEWGVWGPRFRNGLQDGSRVMLRYSIV